MFHSIGSIRFGLLQCVFQNGRLHKFRTHTHSIMANGGRFWLKGQAGVKGSGRGRLKGKGELEILITF